MRTALKNIIGLIPAVVLIAAILNSASCGSSGLLGSDSNGGGSGSPTGSPTGTPTPTGTLAFVTNFNDGMVSSFTRNTSTGALKLTGQTTAGKKSGPRGIVAAPSGAFLYVANLQDDNIYEFAVNSTNGTLTPLSPAFVSNGNATEPDEIAMNAAGTLMWVTGMAGTVTSYSVSTSTGQITNNGSLGGFNTPFGMALNESPSPPVLYMSDTTTGFIWPLIVTNTSTGALSTGTAVHSSDPAANTPAAIAIELNSTPPALFVPDQVNGEVSAYSIDSTGTVLTPIFAYSNSATTVVPVGIGIGVNAGVEYLFTANQAGNSVSSFIVTFGTTLTVPPTVAGTYPGATGLVVDPQNAFVYTADFSNGTVSQSTIKGTCGSSLCSGTTISTEKPANAGSGPFGITLAQ